MGPIEQLRDRIQAAFPCLTQEIDPPDLPTGSYFLDVRRADELVVVEYDPNRGFGVSDCTDPEKSGYGVHPDTVHPDINSAFAEVQRILTQHKPSPR